MEKNVGGIDRTARLIIGVVLVAAGAAGLLGYLPVLGVLGGVVAGIIGLVLLGTAVTRKCMINDLLDKNTYEGKPGE